MSVPTVDVLVDVAAEMGIADPSLVEKDFFVTRVLDICMNNVPSGFQFAFAGGTSLSKAYRVIGRMSEDIDLKVFPDPSLSNLTRSARKRVLRDMRSEILSILAEEGFHVPTERIKTADEYKYSELNIPYPQQLAGSTALRPEIKLDLRVCEATITSVHPISSFVAEFTGKSPEIPAAHCIPMDQTAAEKLVAFLRRTADILKGAEHDPTLVRHAYDLHALESDLPMDRFISLARNAMEYDLKQFRNSGENLRESLQVEITATLAHLEGRSVFAASYQDFLGPLVYSNNRPTWDAVLGSVSRLAGKVWNLELGSEIASKIPSTSRKR